MSTMNNSNLNQTLNEKHRQQKQIGDFIVGKILGQGTFGKVRIGTHKYTKEKVAIKILEKKRISETADVQRVTRQIHILKLIRHPNLVQLYQIIETPTQLFLIMEFMENGELFNYIVKNKRIKEDEARRLFHEIIDGIEYIHKIGVAHRDLKPENILLNYNKSLKIVDFGLSNTYKKPEMLKTPCGSPCYAAPEMIQGQKYDGLKVDIWSSGVILFAMLNGYLPFEDEDTTQLYKKVLSGNYSFISSISSEAKDLVQKILNNKPNERYNISQIRQHPWMKKHTNKKYHEGIIVGYNKIPVDQDILKTLNSFGSRTFDLDYVQTCIEANRHNEATVMYHLAMKKHLKAGGVSKFDLGNNQFDPSSIQPAKRKDNTTQLLIDNFLTKNSCDITQQEKRKLRLSHQKDDNKENIGIYMNKKKSKQKVDRKSKDKSKDNIKMSLKQQNCNTSHMLKSVNDVKSVKPNLSVQKRLQNPLKKPKLGSSTGKVQRKGKSTKLDGSINYGRVTLTKSIEKHSGRQSEPHSSGNNRQSIIQNRVSRKYRQQFDQSLVSRSKGKIKTQTQRQRMRINSSVNQSINNFSSNYQGFNTTVINTVNTYSGHALMNLSKKYKDHDSSTGYIEQYLMKGKKLGQKKIGSGQSKQANDSSKIIKPKNL